jgi:hypothetical protein
MYPRSWSAYENLINEFGCKIIEMEISFREIVFTYGTICLYLEAPVENHINPNTYDLHLVVSQYGIGNYEEAYKDFEEFSVIFN